MDAQTRIGLGGTALFTLAGIFAPVLTWWVSGPIMLLCACFAMWGLWPIAKRLELGLSLWPFGRVPIQDAAQQLYEAAEKADALKYLIAEGASPLYKLETFKYVMMVDDEAVLIGEKPPSRRALPIPHEELRGSLMPVEGTSQLNYPVPLGKIAYSNVTIGRRDLRRIKRRWPSEAKEWAKRFGR